MRLLIIGSTDERDPRMLRMLVMGGDERRRQGIARSIGRRGPIRVELAGRLECARPAHHSCPDGERDDNSDGQ